MRTRLVVIVVLLVVVVAVARLAQPAGHRLSLAPSAGPLANSEPGQVLAARTKTVGCSVNGALPDTDCTPGAVIPTATPTQICRPGYAKSVRNVPYSEKDEVYAEYGIPHHQPGQYEVDHLVSLELGGSNDVSNLWPEAANPTPGFHQKDAVENYLHDQVCNGALPLAQAQAEIAGNWMDIFQNLPH